MFRTTFVSLLTGLGGTVNKILKIIHIDILMLCIYHILKSDILTF